MGMAVNLDSLPLKRVLDIDESGTERFPPEPTQEDKPRILLQRLDFGQSSEKDTKKAKTTKEPAATPSWPWQNLVEHLQQAQEELSIILDFLSNVEANDALAVFNMVKPKPLLHEACSDFALRASVKLHAFKKVGKYLKHNAKSLEHQVERESIFYGALMRLQRNWKVKRQRAISGGSGGNAGFTIDLSYPTSAESIMGLSTQMASLYTVNIEQDASGLLTVHLPRRQMHKIQLKICVDDVASMETYIKDDISPIVKCEATADTEKLVDEKDPQKGSTNVGEGIDEGACVAHSLLRQIQDSIYNEKIYGWVVREALQPSSGIMVSGICENSMQLGLGSSSTLVIKLVEKRKDETRTGQKEETSEKNESKTTTSRSQTLDPSIEGEACKSSGIDMVPYCNGRVEKGGAAVPSANSGEVSLHDAFFQAAFMGSQIQEAYAIVQKSGNVKVAEGTTTSSSSIAKSRDSGASSGIVRHSPVDAAGPLKCFCSALQHRVCCYKLSSELEKLVKGIPQLCVFFHPTWQSHVTSWDLELDIPQTMLHGIFSQSTVNSAMKKFRRKFFCNVVLCETSLSVEGIEALKLLGDTYIDNQQPWSRSCDLSELPGLLLAQIAGHFVTWLHQEAQVLGLKVRRDFLSLFFHINSYDDFAIVASLDVEEDCINWWLYTLSLKEEESFVDEVLEATNYCKRLLGPVSLELLRGLILDFLNLSNARS